MKKEVFLFIVMLVINLLVVIVYWLFHVLRDKEKKGSYKLRCVVMLLCPLLGPCFFLLGWLIRKLFFRKPVDLEDVIFSKQRTKQYMKADEERERNIVPLQEAMAVTSKIETRNLVLQVVRRDIRDSLMTIQQALNSDDSEVSHYAASILQDSLGNFRDDTRKMYEMILTLERKLQESDDPENQKIIRTKRREELENNKGEAETACTKAYLSLTDLADVEAEKKPYTSPVHESGGNETITEEKDKTDKFDYSGEKETNKDALNSDEKAQERVRDEAYVQALAAAGISPDSLISPEILLRQETEACASLIDDITSVVTQNVFSAIETAGYAEMLMKLGCLMLFRDVPPVEQFAEICTVLLQSGNEKDADWCIALKEIWPGELLSYKCLLKLYYTHKQPEEFHNALESLKKTKIELDPETLDIIRFFQETGGSSK